MESTQCPRCGNNWSKVLETREAKIHGFPIILRIRKCQHPNCGKQFRTKEIVDLEIIMPSGSERSTTEGKEKAKESKKQYKERVKETKKKKENPDTPLNEEPINPFFN